MINRRHDKYLNTLGIHLAESDILNYEGQKQLHAKIILENICNKNGGNNNYNYYYY